MPRDNKGNGFGHGSKMKDLKGHVIQVEGFMTQVHGRIDVGAVQALVGPKFKVYRWTDLENLDPKEATAAVSDTTDHCAVDRAQVKHGTANVLSAQGDNGDKVIWGS